MLADPSTLSGTISVNVDLWTASKGEDVQAQPAPPAPLPVIMSWQPCAWMADSVNLWQHFWYDAEVLRDIIARLPAHRAGCEACLHNEGVRKQ